MKCSVILLRGSGLVCMFLVYVNVKKEKNFIIFLYIKFNSLVVTVFSNTVIFICNQ